MICPRCRQFTPDEGFACIQCGAAVQRANPTASAERASSGRPVSRSFFRPWMLAVLALVALLGYVAYGRLNRSHAANAFAPGAELAVENYLAKGRTTIVDFYSDYCPPCRKMAPLLARLAKKRPDLAVVKLDINRKGVEGIDWGSPLARQYQLGAIPYFRIYDGEGNLLRDGPEATQEIVAMLVRAGIDL